jgi:uracil-DNA glycosylase
MSDRQHLGLAASLKPKRDFLGVSIVGEAPGADEVIKNEPFVGRAGHELSAILTKLGIERDRLHITNTFLARPPDNQVLWFFEPYNGTDDPESVEFYRSRVLRKEWIHSLARLHDELVEIKPKLIITLGATALWALTGEEQIGRFRGKWTQARHLGVPLLPTWHPAALLYDRAKKGEFELDIAQAFAKAQG